MKLLILLFILTLFPFIGVCEEIPYKKVEVFFLTGDSMVPTIIEGDIVCADINYPFDKLKKNDIIVFNYKKFLICHRIYDIKKLDNGKKLMITKGDNISKEFTEVVDEKSYIGLVIGIYDKKTKTLKLD